MIRQAIATRFLLCIFALGFLACDEIVLHSLSEFEANRTIVKLSLAGVPAKKSRDGSAWNVRVGKSDYRQALLLVSSQRSKAERTGGRATPHKSLVYSREEREYFIERSLATHIEETLQQLPGVVHARVHLRRQSIHFSRANDQKANEACASVLLVVSSESPALRNKATELVVGAAGVAPNRVHVVEMLDELQAASKQLRSDSTRTAHQLKYQFPRWRFVDVLPSLKEYSLSIFIGGVLTILSMLILKLRNRRLRVLSRLKEGESGEH